jgi:hypothetical protein
MKRFINGVFSTRGLTVIWLGAMVMPWGIDCSRRGNLVGLDCCGRHPVGDSGDSVAQRVGTIFRHWIDVLVCIYDGNSGFRSGWTWQKGI